MIKFLSILCFIFCLSQFGLAQRAVVEVVPQNYTESQQGTTNLKTRVYEIKEVPLSAVSPFLAVSVVWHAPRQLMENERLWVGFGNQNEAWTEFYDLREDSHTRKEAGRYISNLLFVDKDVTQFRLFFQTDAGENLDFDKLTVHFFNPGETNSTSMSGQPVDSRDACVCPIPPFLDRAGWCPDGSCPIDNTPNFTTVTHLIVHHTATSNTSSDWGAVVRSIWNFHVNSNGWDDIGYNWLIDPTGVLYQGRGNDVQGAHFCGQNGGTMGVAMIGNFVEEDATEAAKNTLEKLLAWKTCDINADPLGSAFHASSSMNLLNISGHRDGCQTTCPGDFFYANIPDIRQEVVTIRDNDCDAKLDAPSLEGDAISETLVNLTWSDDTEEDNFILERSVGNDVDFQLLAELPANTTAYQDATVVAQTTYYYRVQATSSAIINSDYSNEIMVSTDFSAVQNFYLNEQTVRIFPNPNGGVFQLELDNSLNENIQVSVMDMAGKTVFTSDFKEKKQQNELFTFHIEELSAGTYLLKVVQGTHQGFFKLFVQ